MACLFIITFRSDSHGVLQKFSMLYNSFFSFYWAGLSASIKSALFGLLESVLLDDPSVLEVMLLLLTEVGIFSSLVEGVAKISPLLCSNF